MAASDAGIQRSLVELTYYYVQGPTSGEGALQIYVQPLQLGGEVALVPVSLFSKY